MGIRVLIAGGGTSGHINPAIAIADCIRQADPESVIEFCGTERGLENDIVPRSGYILHPIRATGIPSKPSLKMAKAFADFAAGRKTSISIIRSFKPDVVVGTGGYVCAPLVAAAYHVHIPVLLHEQNAFPGRSNLLMSKKANIVCTSFPGMESSFPKARTVIFTGNPVKKEFFETTKKAARNELNIADNIRVLLAMGGSLGSRTINQSVVGLSQLIEGAQIHIILSAGKQQFSALGDIISAVNDKIDIKEYIYNPHIYMAAADILICRSGAITCAEVAALGIPSIMIPYPFAAGDHQTYNARVFEKEGAAIIMRDADVSAKSLYDAVMPIIDDQPRMQKMSESAKSLAKPMADRDITTQIFKLAGRKL
jgi:UDP-N-acetylglucosamine--N-acetylmuramyl-(pentapeptide) pyrophosphoryl-undecaprenol N-acetylglucosamine transferase